MIVEFELRPDNGWEVFSRHKELTDLIFETFIPLVNRKDWHYMNFVRNTSMFEDINGNILTLLYMDDNAGNIVKIHFSKPKTETTVSKEMSHMLTLLSEDYGLRKLHNS